MPARALLSARARLTDVAELVCLEQLCFHCDRLSERSFGYHIRSERNVLLLAEQRRGDRAPILLGYGLCLFPRRHRWARLYSLAVAAEARGRRVGKTLIAHLELHAVRQERWAMRLEVAKANCSALALYRACGYVYCGEYKNYYEDGSDAWRMQKVICGDGACHPAAHR